MAEIVRPVKGTQDYYPEEMAVRSWLYGRMRAVSEAFGYQEYDGPFLERLELYAAKSGEELVEKQSYVFEDRGGERVTLRPELTPTLARMVAARQKQMAFPLRWWSFGPFWRYERPQKGRSREFFQWNIDLIGDDSPEGDAELAAIAASFLRSVGLRPDESQILVNNRPLMQRELEALGIAAKQLGGVYRLIDRRDKLDVAKWEAMGKVIGLDKGQLAGLSQLLSDIELWKKSDSLKRFFDAIDAYGVNDMVRYAPTIIRGLDYYTGTVFEAWDTAGDFRSIFGGGRYDDLVNAVGGDPVPAVGFAVGNVVLTLLLEKLGHVPALGSTPAPVYVTLFDADSLTASLTLASELRVAGLNVTSHLSPDKLQKQFKQADRLGAKIVVILGPEEAAQGQVSFKELAGGEQQSVARGQAAAAIGRLLESAQGT
ncbi:MAG: histidine--tRNA ligase [Chloroflexi bacterium]|nr:histidine--tRNA ligase [Chloroflexota bacterium]